MGVPSYLTYDGNLSASINPFRPGIDSVGGASFLDDSQYPPDPTTMMTAAVENQNEMLIVAMAKVTPCAVIIVQVSGGIPSISSVRAAGSLLSSSDFTVTDLGTGFTELICPATKIIQPLGCIAVPQATGDFRSSAYVNGTSNGIRIEIRNSSGTLTDCNFMALWF